LGAVQIVEYPRPDERKLEASGNVSLCHGCIKLTGPRAVPARSGHDGSLIFWCFAHPGVFLCATSRDGSRSDPEMQPCDKPTIGFSAVPSPVSLETAVSAKTPRSKDAKDREMVRGRQA
jgi:hypothetical protein